MLGAADPQLAAIDDVVLALAPGEGRDAGGVGSAVRLGHREGLQAQRARGDLGQPAVLLRRRAMPQQRAHHVYLGVAGRAVGARAVDLLQHRRGGRERCAAAAVRLRYQHGEIAGVGQGADELGGVFAVAVQRPPIRAGETRAQAAHPFADVGMGIGGGPGHAQEYQPGGAAQMTCVLACYVQSFRRDPPRPNKRQAGREASFEFIRHSRAAGSGHRACLRAGRRVRQVPLRRTVPRQGADGRDVRGARDGVRHLLGRVPGDEGDGSRRAEEVLRPTAELDRPVEP